MFFPSLSLKTYFRGICMFAFITIVLNWKKTLLIGLLIFITSSIFISMMPYIPPYDDQQEDCLYRKTAMLLSSFREVYDSHKNNLYTYFPSILLIQFPWAIIGWDLRYLYLIFLIIGALMIYKFGNKRYKFLGFALVLFSPEFIIRCLNMENTILIFMAVIVIFFFMPLRRKHPFYSGIFISLALLSKHQVVMFLPFLILYLIFKKEWKFLNILLFFLALIILPFLISNPYGFYKGVVWQMVKGQPYDLWIKYKTFRGWNLPSLLAAIGIPPQRIFERFPSVYLQLFTYLGFIFLYIKKALKGDTSLSLVFKLGITAVIFVIFFSKRMRCMPSYYLSVLIPLAFWDKDKFENLHITKSITSISKCLMALLVIYLSASYFIGKHYFNKWCTKNSTREIVITRKEVLKNLSYLPKQPLNLITGWGFMNNNMRYTIAAFLPKGSYLVKVYQYGENTPIWEQKFVNNKYFLKFPIKRQGDRIYLLTERAVIKDKIELKIFPLTQNTSLDTP